MTVKTTTTTQELEESRPFDWFRTLSSKGRLAFAGSFGGFALDSYDFQVLPLGLASIGIYFGIGTGEAGLLTTVTLVMSALGGTLCGILTDKIGRIRTLRLTVVMFTVFTVLCGFATSFPELLIFRAFQGLGFGGEWAAGAILVAEYSQARYRGRATAFVQSAWAVGWALSVLVYTIVFAIFEPDFAWRVLFWTSAFPAIFIVWLRRHIEDVPDVTEKRATAPKTSGTFRAIFTGPQLRTTILAASLATGVQGGYYTMASWLPTYLKKARGLTDVGTGGYLAILISGAFLGYVTGGILCDKLGRKRTMQLFAVLSMLFMVGYTQVPAGANTLVLLLGFPLGFCTSAIFSGFGSFLSELYPAELRGTGQGFTYNFGRAVGAVFPTVVGFLAATKLGIGGAMVFGAAGYGIALLALLGLPETRGRALA